MHRHPDVFLSICCTERRLSALAAVAHPHRPAHANSESPNAHTRSLHAHYKHTRTEKHRLLPCKHMHILFVYRPARAGCRHTSCAHACNLRHALFCAVPNARPTLCIFHVRLVLRSVPLHTKAHSLFLPPSLAPLSFSRSPSSASLSEHLKW